MPLLVTLVLCSRLRSSTSGVSRCPSPCDTDGSCTVGEEAGDGRLQARRYLTGGLIDSPFQGLVVAFELAIGQVSPGQVGSDQLSSEQAGIRQVGPGQVDPGQVAFVAVSKPRLFELV